MEAGFVPAYRTEETFREEGTSDRRSITVYALKENKRPVGFAPWPDDPPKRKRKRKA